MRAEDDGDQLEAARAVLAEFCGGAAAFEHRDEVPPVPGNRNQRRGDEPGDWKILDNQEEPVALDEPDLERGCAAGAVRVMMIDDGGRRIPAFPSGPSGAQAEVGVLAIEEEVLVESADLFQHRPAVEGGRSAGKQDFLKAVEAGG